jgi:hypothetical protein
MRAVFRSLTRVAPAWKVTDHGTSRFEATAAGSLPDVGCPAGGVDGSGDAGEDAVPVDGGDAAGSASFAPVEVQEVIRQMVPTPAKRRAVSRRRLWLMVFLLLFRCSGDWCR